MAPVQLHNASSIFAYRKAGQVAVVSSKYLKRVFGSFFYDQGLVLDNNNRMELRSIGVDLNFEINPFRLQVLPIETGIRCSYIPELKNFSFELLIFRTIF